MQTKSQKLANLYMLEKVAHQLGPLCKDVVFLGGCTTALFITDAAAPDVRHTLDVDCIVDVISRNQYHELEKQLRKQGFKQSLNENIICRWHFDNILLDVMPTDEKILGFGNKWYKPAIQQAQKYTIGNIEINVVTAPYFLATKVEALKTRGKMDFFASHDFEDIVSVMDGRPEIKQDIQKADKDLKHYLQYSFEQMLDARSFHDALPGHFILYGNLAEDRIGLFLDSMTQIISS